MSYVFPSSLTFVDLIRTLQIPKFADAAIATRKAGQDSLQPLAKAMPLFISGSADLHGSTLNYIAGGNDFTRKNYAGTRSFICLLSGIINT